MTKECSMTNDQVQMMGCEAIHPAHWALNIGHSLVIGHRSLVIPPRRSPRACRNAGFTLAEVLAALMFMAIVIPVAMQGLKIPNLSGEVAVRKAEAARVAERVLNESIITTNWNRSTASGVAMEGTHQFRYQLRTGPWLQEPMRALSVQVSFGVQGQNYDVLLSTLVDNSPPQ